MTGPLLATFFIGGFEASTMRRRDGRRNDLVSATRHDDLAESDYRRLMELGILTVREGAAWHRIEPSPGRFDHRSVVGRIRTAERLGVQVVWDLCHFGWPDDVDVFAADFPDRLARFASWFAHLLRNESSRVPWFVPVNEPSFVAWAGGDVAYLNPFERGRGDELKRQLVRASLRAAGAVRSEDPRARICHVDPIIHIEPRPGSAESAAAVRAHNEAQYAAWDMLAGRLEDELGGAEAELDVIGVNYYDRNQWIDGGPILAPGEPGHRQLRDMLVEVHRRYRRPIIVAETGTEGDGRAAWLARVCDEVAAARAAGAAIEGVCLYPVIDYPGWDDDRRVPVGMWGFPEPSGDRPEHEPLITEARRQIARFQGGTVSPLANGTALTDRPLRSSMHVGRDADDRADRRVIVLATDSRAPSGMGNQMLTLARGLTARYRVVVAAPDAVDARWLIDAAVEAGLEVWALTDGSPLAQGDDLRRRLVRERVDLVNVHAGIGWEGHALASAPRTAGGHRVVRTEHLPYLLTKPRDADVYRRGLANVDRIIAVSQAVATSHRSAGVAPELIRVVRNGIDDPGDRAGRGDLTAKRGAIRHDLDIDPDAPMFVSVGRLTRQKGYDVLLPAASLVARRRSDARFVIVGSGPLADWLDLAIADLGLGPIVRWIEQIDDIPSLLSAATGLVLASRFEGLPLVALEAMAVGRPVVATRVRGLDETVEDGLTGTLVDPDDPEALAAAVLALLGDPSRAAAYGAAGRSRYEAEFTARRMVDETARVFDELFEADPGTPDADAPSSEEASGERTLVSAR